MDVTASGSGLSMDLRHGNVIKIGARRSVTLARRGDAWLARKPIAEHTGTIRPTTATTWHVNSPFDSPTLWFFFAARAAHPGRRGTPPTPPAFSRTFAPRSTDSHTHGELKRHIARDLAGFVRPAGSVRPVSSAGSKRGKRLFVVTTPTRVSPGICDHVTRPAWRDLFDLVFTDAGKPRFFTDAPSDARARRRGHVVDLPSLARGGTPRVRPSRILYAGDNARADIVPARRRGWKTLTSWPELAVTPWAPGGALDHDGAPTGSQSHPRPRRLCVRTHRRAPLARARRACAPRMSSSTTRVTGPRRRPGDDP
jgi:hypothetical protein